MGLGRIGRTSALVFGPAVGVLGDDGRCVVGSGAIRIIVRINGAT